MTRFLTLSASLAVLVGGVTAALAVDFAQRDPEFPPRVYTCRADGTDVPLGMRRCLRTPQGTRLAECGIAINMSTWRASGEPCP